MLGHRELTAEDYFAILKRRLRLIAVCAIVFLGVGVGLTYVLPPQYMSQTLILIEEQKVPEKYVVPVVTEDLGARLSSMKEQILSRSRVQPIIERFNLFAGAGRTLDERIEMTQKAIGIKPIQSTRGMPGFFISFKAQDARTAQQVCGEITSLFVSENLSAREQSAEGTTDFLKQQLEDAKRQLDDQDAKLADFERKNIGKLPGGSISIGNGNISMGSASQSMLGSMTSQLEAANQSVGRLEQSQTLLQAMITQETQNERSSEPSAGGVSVDERKAQLKALINQRNELLVQYQPDYPDVVAVNRKIADLQAAIAHPVANPEPAAAAAQPTNKKDSPELFQLKSQLRAEQQNLTAAKQEQARIQEQIKLMQSRIEASPAIEEEYKQVTRDHDIALQFYNSLLSKMNESSMATALEHRQQGEQFHVMDAPNLPDSPSFPNPFIFAGGGLFAGIMVGICIAAWLEYRDTTIRNEKDVWAFTKLPTLATISFINGLPQPTRDRKSLWPFTRPPKPIENANG
jgi:polysaccharide chain length determinant protein (PEP-CTERM system associated)